MDFQKIIDKYYPLENEQRRIYMTHARKVADLALDISRRHPELNADDAFIEEAAMLHDLGMFLVDAPRIHCFGDAPYICHGYLGANLLRNEGFERHALVCERHTGTGLSKELIESSGWPLPSKDMLPLSIEEQIICFADKFYSKTKFLEVSRTIEQVEESMRKISEESVEKIRNWAGLFL